MAERAVLGMAAAGLLMVLIGRGLYGAVFDRTLIAKVALVATGMMLLLSATLLAFLLALRGVSHG